MRNKIAIITGGSRGLGKSIAEHLAKEGVNIIFTYHTQEQQAAEVVKILNNLGVKAAALPLSFENVSYFESFTQQVENVLTDWQADGVDYLVNNAGHLITKTIADMQESDFDSLYNTHLKGTFFLTQALLPQIRENGRIINTSTGLTRFTKPGYSAYAMMKGAVEIMTRYMAKELGNRKIRVNTVAPGPIETDFGGGSVRDNEQDKQFLSSQTALERCGLSDDVGGAVLALLRDESGWINGQRIEVSGGIFL